MYNKQFNLAAIDPTLSITGTNHVIGYLELRTQPVLSATYPPRDDWYSGLLQGS